jgi:hypothetical protein
MSLSPADRVALIEKYGSAPARFRAALAAVPAESMHWRPAPGEFSIHEIVCHCADAETIDAGRIRYLVTEDNATIVSYDESAWARELDYENHPLDPALATVDALHANTVGLLRRLPDEAWQASGTHTRSGHITAADWLRVSSEHLDVHVGQIKRNVDVWRSR